MNRFSYFAVLTLAVVSLFGCTRQTIPLAPIPPPPPSWQPVGNLDFSTGRADYPQLFISNNGTPYAAYSDYSNNELLTVMAMNGSTWSPVGSADFTGGAYLSSLYVYNNTPYVTFQTGVNATGPTMVVTYNGSAWVTLGSPNFSSASEPCLSGYNGTPYLAFLDTANGNNIIVMDYTAGAWATVGNADFAGGNENYLSLDATSGTPYVAFCDNNNGSMATVMKYNGSAWVNVGTPGFSAGMIGYTSLSVNNGIPYLEYQDIPNMQGATVQEFNGTNWVPLGTPGAVGIGNLITLSVGAGTPYIGIQEGTLGDDLVIGFTKGAWVTVGTQNFMIGNSRYASVATDQAGHPYIGYQDYGKIGQACVYEYH
jgi:hypothetical protein